MIYKIVKEGRFISRPNRFIALVETEGKTEICHVKNTGRCKELFLENATVFLEESENPLRKTKYDVIAVLKGDKLINIDSIAPNVVAYEYLVEKYPTHNIKKEVVYKNSRFDIFDETTNTFIEVKGVTLENKDIASFPDAPTKRGQKHIYELIDAKETGYNAQIMFVIQFKGAKKFTPNFITDLQFADALKKAQKKGVIINAYDCIVRPDSLMINREVEVCLDLF